MTTEFTREQVAAHSQPGDAFIIIDNVVYDVTAFLDDHPGGAEVLLDNAGRDASDCFHDIGHSQDARDWMLQFRAGEVAAAERREVRVRSAPCAAPGEGDSLRGLLAAWAPPLALSALAALLYFYLFG
ncbi:hypothetical protein JYU34_003960 [Plutella xylostella]|uniref:Cytochrome b5 mRNA n=1 Tax=Plutella xylostella TaxID=51655 RepID=A0A0B4N527_PLUXY|nr:cytochrome b5 [Plutella xylostella]KAG7311095.1 hypothetical protein JYU34_003960 [Plutella xylostella]